jgi:large subunit ribosomal protein L18
MPTRKELRRKKIKRRVRKKISGTAERPRLSVFKSNKQIYAQVIDDRKGHTMAAASSKAIGEAQNVPKTEQAKAVGKELAKKAQEANIEKVAFDRNGYRYHGRVKALAEAAREEGLKF